MHGKKALNKLKKKILGFAKGVKPFKNQIYQIPGLQTPKWNGKGERPKKGAIMRHMNATVTNSARTSKKLQEKALEEESEAIENEAIKRFNSGNKSDIAARIASDMRKFGKEAREHTRKTKGYYDPNTMRQYAENNKKKAFAKSIIPEINKLDAYIATLSKNNRFANVKGPLYDPVTGWNPGYRVLAKDLLTIIPAKPFSIISKKRNIPFGKPVEAETDSIGFMPFKWAMTKGGYIGCVNPILYELQRARAIRFMYEKLMHLAMYSADFYGSSMKNEKWFGIYAKAWNQWNHPEASHDILDYPKKEDVVFEDFFPRFLKKFRAGKIEAGDNTLDWAKDQFQDGWLLSGEQKDWVADHTYRPYVNAGKFVVKKTKEKIENVKRFLSYDKYEDKVEEEEELVKEPEYGDVQEEYSVWNPLGWFKKAWRWVRKIVGWVWKKVKKVIDKVERARRALARLNSWKDQTFANLNYGKVRDLMIDDGVMNMFDSGQITNTTLTAIPLIKKLVDMGILNKAPSADNANSIHDLMWNYFNWTGDVSGYEWKHVVNDPFSQAAFAQSFLEYFALKVVPAWNKCEELLSEDITWKTDKTANDLRAGITALHELLSRNSIMSWLDKHLRFPNMKVQLVTLNNATADERAKILGYMQEMNILTAEQKNANLKNWQGWWPKLSTMSDQDLASHIDILAQQIKSAHYEVMAVGDMSYEHQLRKFYRGYTKERDRRLDAKAAGAKQIVKKPGEVVNVLEAPPKTLEEIEEEKRKEEAERKKREEEEKRKAEEEREKKLKEEAKRKEQLAIAEAKIKAMEAIKKQEENYEKILEKMISTPDQVTKKELDSLGDEVKNLKQEAENRIAQLPREERELKLSLIRGDKISDKTFKEMKDTAIGLHGSLQGYIEEVNKIPVGSVMAIQKQVTPNTDPVAMSDPDNVDMGD